MILAFYLHLLVISCSVMFSVTQYLGPQQQQEKQITVLEQKLLGRLKAIIEIKTQQDMGIFDELNTRFTDQMFTTQNLFQSLLSAVNDCKQQISDLKLFVEGQTSPKEDLQNISRGCKQQISDFKLLIEGHMSKIEDVSKQTNISNNWNQQISDLQILIQEQKIAIGNLSSQINAVNDLNQQVSDLQHLVQEQKTAMDNLRTQINPFSRVRLIGPFLLEGRVEIYHNGEWGTVCDDYWEDVDASVVCKELGFRRGTAMIEAHYGEGTGRTWMDTVECTGSETRLAECPFDGLNTENCDHDEDAGVRCT